ncbi:hypothetical protein GE061_000670 [Apolygus lucorum]|uniref:Uncharacterized protein n=1 Tax=Apolygus lucorum TaxID=248454 RepID=A0A8S9Y6H8_APOLU|nr:hypothetical protein GE061_000670 [Apolygus lucorum]
MTDDDQEDQPRPPRRVHFDTPVARPITTRSHGVDIPTDMLSQGIDTPVDTPIDTSQQGIDTPIDSPIDTSPQGTDTPLDTMSQQGIDTFDTSIDTSSQQAFVLGIPDETFIDPIDIERTPHETTTSAPVEETPETEKDDRFEEYGWETRKNVTISNLPSTSTPAHDAVHKETSIQLNELRDTGHLRDADHHFDRSTESKVTGEHDRHEDSSTPETHDRHDGTHDRHEDSHDRHEDSHDRHEDSHDRHDVSHDRHGNRHDHQENQHHTSSPDSESEEEEFKDAENDPPRKRLRGYEEDTPARYSLRKRESNVDYRQLHLGKRQTD